MWAVLLLLCVASVAYTAPAPQAPTSSPNKSAFIPAFDEIVVESSLRVKGRSGPTNPIQRQGRTKLLVVPTPGTPLNGTSSSTSTSTTSTSTAAAVTSTEK
ncbi:uncharacterized protein LOC128991118 [Macrosteles quadrilineatus]|uniref:uncharacterized protein LOC128991118 n=1 Tax=Macrosteles quadrilineatus TaxID=74068 RepID=UPI0023E19C17|nr:uncharacterized protein LOC128991118 [Macrosteles quadrilineatus]